MNKMFPLNLTKDTTELKRLIAENPDLPIVVLVGEEANGGDYSWMYCDRVTFRVEEMLDAEAPYQEEVETDRTNFEEQMEEWLWDKMGGNDRDSKLTEEEFQTALTEEKAKYEPYWKKVIAIFATN